MVRRPKSDHICDRNSIDEVMELRTQLLGLGMAL
uniref:Uncharacterized protein n=1 Tax=Arundo donax TaxID=35708 RepID=A0A0A9F0S0_ARUDO